MSTNRGPPFRAEHVGSLLRPSELFEKRTLFQEGKCTAEELKAAEDKAIVEIVKLQRDAGIETITDGEVRRGMFFEGVFDNLEGMTVIPQRPIHEWKKYIPHIGMMYAMGVPAAETIYCSGKIRRVKPFYVDQFKSLKSQVAPEEVKNLKITMCSPSWYHQRHGSDLTYDLSVYKNDEEYFDDLGKAYREEIQELYDIGCRHIQFDDPTFCYFCDKGMISGMEEAGVDHEALLDSYIRAINICVQPRPGPDLVVSVHMCRGNLQGMHFSSGGYLRISEKLFKTLDADVFYLEYDDDRAGDFEPLKYLPTNKKAVLGIVTSKRPELESVESLKDRVFEAAKIISEGNPPRSFETALDQLSLSPQCGFAAVWQGNLENSASAQKEKLELLVRAANEIWPA